jgi:hypothetical protein
MGLLEKLRPQPRWKNADPAVRLEALKELDDKAELDALAEFDPDVRVRRAVVGRLDNVTVLGQVARADADLETRDRAGDRLLALATGKGATNPEDTVTQALEAVMALTDTRRLAMVVKTGVVEAARAEALARISDERQLGSIARHADAETTALAALAKLTSRAEILEVVLHAAHKDVACRAFDRMIEETPDLALLRSIETRTQQKAVGKRARTLIFQIESAEAAERAAVSERERRGNALCEALELVASFSDLGAARAELARLRDAWEAFGSTDAALLARFSLGGDAVEQTMARREREAEEEADFRRLRAEAIATRDALCARVETLDGDDVLEQLTPIEEEWRSLLPLVGNGLDADRLAERFAQAVVACRRRHALRLTLADDQAKLEALVIEGETLIAQPLTDEAAARWQVAGREAHRLAAQMSEAARPATELVERLAPVDAAFSARGEILNADVRKARTEVLAQLQRLSDRAKRAADAETMTLREGERLMRDIGAGFEAAAHLEAGRDLEEASAKLRGLQERIAPRVREAREMDDWRRFANAQRQEQLIAMAEAIVTSLKTDAEANEATDLGATARALRELHAKWHEVAEAPRQNAQRLWDRFRTATDFIRARCEVYFARLREERQQNLQKRAALVAEAEHLAASNDWAKTAVRFQELQTEWRETGPIGQDAGRELAHRFRLASNAFFARRREDLTVRKKALADNLSKKEALCERAEQLTMSSDWEHAAAEIKRLQSEWKTIGPVRRSKSEVVWNRFRAAADQFFDRFHRRHEIALEGKLAEREAFVVALEAIAATALADLPADLGDRVRELRATWNHAVPVPAPGMKLLTERWQAALAKVVAAKPDAFAGSDLDPHAVVQRMTKLVERVESFVAELHQPEEGLSQTELLAARLRSAFASNAMGGRANDESKWRAAADAVRDAEAAWQRLTPTSLPEARALEQRFRNACREVAGHTRRSNPRRSVVA